MSDTFISDIPDLQGFIKELDLLDENVNAAVRQGMHEGADIILAEQKRRADATGVLFLARHINKGAVYTTKRGSIGITTGYQSEAFKPDADGKNSGVIGLTYEFGRPGQSRTRSGKTMKQVRGGKAVEVSKGKISPRPHIRPAFDAKVKEASERVIEAVTDEIGKVFNE